MGILKDWLINIQKLVSPPVIPFHTYVIGQPGTGKSKALEGWAIEDIQAGRGVGVIDPHGDLFQNLLLRVANLPEVWPRVVIIDPTNTHWTVSFNPLETTEGVSPERLALFLTDVVAKIWGLEPTKTPRALWILSNSFLAFSELGLTLLDLPRFLLDPKYRQNMLSHLQNQDAKSFFEHEFPTNPELVHQWVTPVLNKIGELLFDPDTRLILTGRSTINFRKILDEKLILLVNLPKGVLGEGASSLLSAFLVAHLQKAAYARISNLNREPFYLYMDEFQNYTTDNIADILSESRKYALHLILAHQYLDQLPRAVESAVLNTAGNLVCFRVGYDNGYRLAKEIFPTADFIPITKGWENLAKLLTQLPQRTYWLKQRGSLYPCQMKTPNLTDPEVTAELSKKKEALLDQSGWRYGRIKADVRREIAKREATMIHQFKRFSKRKSETSIWGE